MSISQYVFYHNYELLYDDKVIHSYALKVHEIFKAMHKGKYTNTLIIKITKLDEDIPFNLNRQANDDHEKKEG